MSEGGPHWEQIAAAKAARRRQAAALPPLEKLRTLDRLRERRNQIYRAVRVFDEAEIARIVERRLVGARRRELEGDPRAPAEIRALALLQAGIDDPGLARSRLADLSPDSQAIAQLLSWFGGEPERIVAGVCAETIRKKARQATQGEKAESRAQPGTRTMLLLYPNIDEQRVLSSERSWEQVAKRIGAALDSEAVAAFDQLWLVRNSSEPLALGPDAPRH